MRSKAGTKKTAILIDLTVALSQDDLLLCSETLAYIYLGPWPL